MKKLRQMKSSYENLEKEYMKSQAEKMDLIYELNQIKRHQELCDNEAQEVRHLHQNARKLKHDMKNHMMVIASYLSANHYEAAKDYTSEVLGKLNTVHSYVETGNDLMNHILNEKMTFAREQGIKIKAEIENLTFSKLKQIDFSTILTNLLDNAIDASLRESHPEMTIHIVKRKGYETVQIKNRISHSVLTDNPTLVSTKENAEVHGLGLLQVKALIDACDGLIDFYEESGYFCVGVFIPA